MYRHKMNSAQRSTQSASIWCGGTESEIKGILAHWGAASCFDLARSEQEEELLLAKRKIQLKENNGTHLQFFGCNSEDWPVIIGNPEVICPGSGLVMGSPLVASDYRSPLARFSIPILGSLLKPFSTSDLASWRSE